MRHRILTMLLLICGFGLSYSIAAPVTSDIGATNQTTIVAALDQPAVLPSFFSSFSSNAICRDHLPGIVLTSSNLNNSAAFITSGRQKQTVFHGTGQAFERIWQITTAKNGATFKDHDNTMTPAQPILPNWATVATSANDATTWTTGYYDDAGNLNATATTSAHVSTTG